MANWLTITDLEEEYGVGDFPVDENNAPLYNVVEDAIEDAQFFIEGYLRRAGVELPANDTVIKQVRKCALIITRYYYSFKTEYMTEELIREYDSMKKFLSDIGSGKVIIDDGEGGVGNKNGGLTNVEIFIL